MDFYNLDTIIAVGYRVNSFQATQFRIWASKTLREFIIKGFVMDDERLKQGQRFGRDFEQLNGNHFTCNKVGIVFHWRVTVVTRLETISMRLNK